MARRLRIEVVPMLVRARPGHHTGTDRLVGPLLTATTVLALNAVTDGELVTHPVHLACVVYSVFRGGVGPGLASSALIVANAVVRAVAVPFGLEEPFRQVNIFALACLVLVLVTGHLKRHADSASRLSQANQHLTGQLVEHSRGEEAAMALAAMTRELVEPLDVKTVHHRIVATIRDLFGVRQALLYELDTASQELTCVAAAGQADDTRGLGHRLPARAAMADARPQVIPLHARGKVLGALALDGTEGALTREADRQRLSIFAGHAALALENSRRYEDVRVTLDRLNGSQSRLVDEARRRATEDLAAGVAHHLNNRLMVIVAGLQLLEPKLANQDQRSLLECVERAAFDTAGVVGRLGQFSRGRPKGVVESADLNLCARRAVELCQADRAEALGRGIGVDIVLELGAVPRVAADEALLEEALAHVVRNAIEAVTSGGVVTITTWRTEAAVLCAVADTGIGMAEDVRQLAAQPFFTTKGPKRLGLGLSSAVGLIRQVGGQVEIHSEVDGGTCVTVHLRASVA